MLCSKQVYNSKWNKEEPAGLLMGAGVYPLRACSKGPAPQGRFAALGPAVSTTESKVHWLLSTADLDEDIIDEALDKFKANVMFRNFKPQGPADLTHLYLLLFIHQCLGR